MVVTVLTQQFGEEPTPVECPNCNAHVTTVTRPINGMLTWLSFGAFIALGLWCGCCLIPFHVKALRNVVHTCPHCNATLGIFKRLDL